MKRILFVALTLGIMLGMSNCEDVDVGLGSQKEVTPDNPFTGGEWLKVYSNEPRITYDVIKLSFTKNDFIFFDGVTAHTGTYKLSIEDGYGSVITISSDKQGLNGKLIYDYSKEDFDHEMAQYKRYKGDIEFMYPPPHVISEILIIGVWEKIN